MTAMSFFFQLQSSKTGHAFGLQLCQHSEVHKADPHSQQQLGATWRCGMLHDVLTMWQPILQQLLTLSYTYS
jgi:hypothetical protein